MRDQRDSQTSKRSKTHTPGLFGRALSSLPDKDTLFALGIDRPLYFSVHSTHAKLAPEGGALIHVAKYLGISIEPKPREDQPELEEILIYCSQDGDRCLLRKGHCPTWWCPMLLLRRSRRISWKARPKDCRQFVCSRRLGRQRGPSI